MIRWFLPSPLLWLVDVLMLSLPYSLQSHCRSHFIFQNLSLKDLTISFSSCLPYRTLYFHFFLPSLFVSLSSSFCKGWPSTWPPPSRVRYQPKRGEEEIGHAGGENLRVLCDMMVVGDEILLFVGNASSYWSQITFWNFDIRLLVCAEATVLNCTWTMYF